MSYLKLNITDPTRTIHSDVPVYFAEALIGSLTAEPDTIEELELALARFIEPVADSPLFGRFNEGRNLEPFEAGIVLIDLAARLVAVDAVEAELDSEGGVLVKTENWDDEETGIFYKLSEDWLFLQSITDYETIRRQRIDERLLNPRIEVRSVLYGSELTGFLWDECSKVETPDEDTSRNVHAKWWMTPRDNLKGRSPREVVLDRQHWMDIDLQWRGLQWSFTKQCPPALPVNSNAYRYSGFGTHEWVVYYYFVEHLIDRCFELAENKDSVDEPIMFLNDRASNWMDSLDHDFGGRTPNEIIKMERTRMPITMSAKEYVIDEDCDICEAMAMDFDTPVFWHLDGCNMHEGFEFSNYKTREEYDKEQKEMEEWSREFNEDLKNRKLEPTGDESDSEPF